MNNRRQQCLPRAPEAEASLIGSVLVDPPMWDRVSPIVSPEDFLDDGLAGIWRAMAALRSEGQPIDATLLLTRLRDAGIDRNVALEVFRLLRETPNSAHADYYAGVVKESANRRRLAVIGGEIRQAALNGETAGSIFAAARARIERLTITPQALPALSVMADEGRTETANARRFAATHGELVRWCDPWGKWLIWDGCRWAVDDRCRIEALAKQTADAIWEAVSAALPGADRQNALALVGFAKSAASANGIAHMLTLARSEPGIPILPAALDAHPWLFNCTNGTVDLQTGELLPHNREHYITKLCPHEYLLGPEGECPIWEMTIDKIFGGNTELVGFFRRLCGSAISGHVLEHILAILWGIGSNGKSLIVETLLDAFGSDYACKGTQELLLASQPGKHTTDKTMLHGRRLVVCAETDDGRRFAEATVKEITGGDTITARRMREDNWSFKPSHTLMLVTNHRPIVRGTDHGIWRRLRLIPFTQQFWDASKGESGPPEMEANLRLREELRPELPGIVAWLVRACREWQRDGLGQPAEVTSATAEYRDSQDTMGQFVADCLNIEEGHTTKASEVRQRYDDWCKANGEKPVSTRRLGLYLQELGITKRKSNGVWYTGVSTK